MDTGTLQRVRELFEELADLPGAERTRRLEGEPAAVRSQVESLLASHESARSFLVRPAAELLAGDEDAPDPFVGFTLGGYRITGLLGTGGMGAVYRAEQTQPRRTVALKVIRAGWATPALRRRFAHEAEALGRLRHPGIAQIFEAGSAPGPEGRETPFFAMELVEGVPLNEHAAKKSLGLRERLALFALVCDAAHHAHQKGIVHRDLKPANILVEKENEGAGERESQGGGGEASTSARLTSGLDLGARPKILDFGIARLTDSDAAMTTMQTDPGQIVGTLAYMSPEQVRGQVDKIDTRSDVYALGVVLFELLTGRLPFEVKDKGVPEAARLIAEEEPTTPGTVDRQVRGDLETIILKAIAKEPERRYQSAAELGADVRRYLSHMPIVARPATTMYQLRKFARRNRVLVGGVAAAFVLLVLGMAGTTAGMMQAKAAQARAQASATRAERANSYLKGTLGWFKPGRTQSPMVTLKDVLDAAAARIDKELAEEPDVASFMHTTIARNYLSLGALDQAGAQADKGLEWARKAGAEDSTEAQEAIELQIAVLSARGKYAEAEPIARGLIALRQKTLPEHDVVVAKGRVVLGALLKGMKRNDEAEKELTEALVDLRAGKSEPNPIIEGANELAMLIRRRQPKQAIVLMREANDLARTSPETTDEERAILTNNLATAVKDDGDYDEAERLYRESLELRRKIYSDDHASVALVINNLGTVQHMRGELDEAEKSYTKALEMRRRLLGPEHRQTLNTLENLARVCEERWDNVQAEMLFREVKAIRVKIDGPEHPDTVIASAQHAGALAKLGKLDEAEPALRTAVEKLRTSLGPKNPEYWVVYSRLAALESSRGRHREAASMYREFAVWVEQNARARWHDCAIGHLNLSKELRVLGEAQEAGREAAAAVEIFVPHVVALSPSLAFARIALAEALNDQKRFAEAEPVARQARAVFGADSKTAGSTKALAAAALAEALAGLNRAQEAEQELLAALAEAEKAEHAESAVRATRARLVKLYEAMGRSEDAARYAERPPEKPADPP